jgi:hypothetical protein
MQHQQLECRSGRSDKFDRAVRAALGAILATGVLATLAGCGWSTADAAQATVETQPTVATGASLQDGPLEMYQLFEAEKTKAPMAVQIASF